MLAGTRVVPKDNMEAVNRFFLRFVALEESAERATVHGAAAYVSALEAADARTVRAAIREACGT